MRAIPRRSIFRNMQRLTQEELIHLNHVVDHLLSTGMRLCMTATNQSTKINNMIDSPESNRQLLREVNDFVRSNRGNETLVNLLADEFPHASNYQRAVAIFESSREETLALEQLRFPSRSQSQISRQVGSAMVYPIMVTLLVAIGFALVCLFTTPTIVSLYAQVQEAPPESVRFLEIARELLPIWFVGILVSVIAVYFWWMKSGRRSSWRWLPGNNAYYQAIEKSHSARLMSQLLNNGCSVSTSMDLATPSHGAAAPLVSWAIQNSNAIEEPVQEVLPKLAEIYGKQAARESQSWETVLPTIAGLVFGGLLVFAYGFSLFIPVVEMLHDLANPLSNLSGQ